MTPYITRVITGIRKKIAEISADALIETNDGTFGPTEAHAKTGSGDPRTATYKVYESLAGARRVVGCDPANAPGYARTMDVQSAASRRAEIEKLQSLAKSLENWPSHQPLPRDCEKFAAMA